MYKRHTPLAAIILSALTSPAMLAQSESTPDTRMSFFITSVGMGKAGNLGGLAGADRHCQTLAESVGAGGRTWHAYLSTSATATAPAVNARDRIGTGPWYNER